jgi:hypothetical protein
MITRKKKEIETEYCTRGVPGGNVTVWRWLLQMKMPPTGPPTEEEIWKITRRTIDIIKDDLGTENVCLFGSAACALWADIGRVPNVSIHFTTNLEC